MTLWYLNWCFHIWLILQVGRRDLVFWGTTALSLTTCSFMWVHNSIMYWPHSQVSPPPVFDGCSVELEVGMYWLASFPGSFLWRKEPGNIGGAEPFTSATSSFMWFPLGTPHFGAIITQFLEGHVRMINSWPENMLLEKATERIRRVRRHWLLSVKITNFKTWEPCTRQSQNSIQNR